VERVGTLRTALRQLRDGPVDVVILDARVHRVAGHAPIVVVSAEHDGRLATAAVRMGAQDFLPKSEIDEQSLLRSIRFSIERSRRRRAEHQLRDSEEQMQLARAIQRRLFPESAPTLEGFDLAGAVFPATATCGDYFDFIPVGTDKIAAVIGDVSGHGVGPALLMAETRAYLRALVERSDCPGEILTDANRLLSGDVGDDHFVSLFFACLDPATSKITYAGAGHAAYHFDAAGQATKIGSTGLVLGLVPQAQITRSSPLTLEVGELLVMMTDGLVETRNREGELLGIERTLSVVSAFRQRPAQKIIEHLYNAARAFAGDTVQEDDIAMIIIKRES